jgi:hypothetical protein
VTGLVSVIVPVFNRVDLLKDCVDSVLAQTYRPVELILVDDGSTDPAARALCDALADTYAEIAAVHQVNEGPGVAREAGRRSARGEFVQYLDSDDLLLKEKLSLQIRALHDEPQCGICYCRTEFVGPRGEGAGKPWKRTGERIGSLFPSMLAERWWGTSTPVYRADLLGRAGPWTRLRTNEDWEYDCRLAAMGVRLCYVPRILSRERGHTGPRQSEGGGREPAKLADRARAHGLVFSHAVRAGIGESTPEMRHFANATFLLARQCGAAGLARESCDLYALAARASPDVLARSAKFRLYGVVARLIGWSAAARLSGRL